MFPISFNSLLQVDTKEFAYKNPIMANSVARLDVINIAWARIIFNSM